MRLWVKHYRTGSFSYGNDPVYVSRSKNFWLNLRRLFKKAFR